MTIDSRGSGYTSRGIETFYAWVFLAMSVGALIVA